MHTVLSHHILVFLLRLVVGFVFLYSGASKIGNPEEFAQAIARYDMLPLWLINAKALVLPWVETIVGVFLLFGKKVRASAFLSGGMLVMFIVAVSVAMARGLDISCGCTSSGGSTVGLEKVIENAALLVACFVLIYFSPEKDAFWGSTPA